jgi:hypothetical protein
MRDSGQYAAMVPANLQVVNQYPASITTSVTGGETINPLWTSEISSTGYRQALDVALQESELFSTVRSISGSDYRLDVRREKAKQPMVGPGMTVSLTSEWTVTRNADNQTV